MKRDVKLELYMPTEWLTAPEFVNLSLLKLWNDQAKAEAEHSFFEAFKLKALAAAVKWRQDNMLWAETPPGTMLRYIKHYEARGVPNYVVLVGQSQHNPEMFVVETSNGSLRLVRSEQMAILPDIRP